MSLHIEQLVIGICQLTNHFLVRDSVITICVFSKLHIFCGFRSGGGFPLAESDLDRSRTSFYIFVLFNLQFEDPVTLGIEGLAAAAVSIGIRCLQ